jgi:PPM family protein phosphatase
VHLYAVADGVGGMAGGADASRLAIHHFRATLAHHAITGDHDLFQRIQAVNDAVLTAGLRLHSTGFGTTLTGLVLRDQRAWIGHVGDSCAMLLRGDSLRLLTDEQTLAAQHSLMLSAREQRDLPEHYFHTLVQCIGFESHIDPTIHSMATQPGDRWLLCTDGLSKVLAKREIHRLLGDSTTPRDAVNALQRAVHRQGAPDNVTVVVVDLLAES